MRMRRAGKVVVGAGAVVSIAALGGLYLLSQVGGEHFPPGNPGVTTTWEDQVVLSKDHPTIARGVTVVVSPGSEPRTDPVLSLGARPVGDTNDHAGDVWISIFDPATGLSIPNPGGTGHATLDGWIGSGRTFAGCGTTACSASYVIVVRWLEPVAGMVVPVTMFADLSATLIRPTEWATPAAPTPSPLAEGLSIVEAPSLRFDGVPSTVSARSSGTASVTAARPLDEARFVLHVPAALMQAPLRYPLVGRLLLTVTDSSVAVEDVLPWASITGPNGTVRGVGGIALDIDWLSGCVPGRDCDVPLSVTYELEPSTAAPSAPLPASAAADVSWTVEARLDALAPTQDLGAGAIALRAIEP